MQRRTFSSPLQMVQYLSHVQRSSGKSHCMQTVGASTKASFKTLPELASLRQDEGNACAASRKRASPSSFGVGIACLSICFIAALISAWRAGFRGLPVCMIPWWLTAFLIFSLPSTYLNAQGNASVFI